jgi:hypothetical protein
MLNHDHLHEQLLLLSKRYLSFLQFMYLRTNDLCFLRANYSFFLIHDIYYSLLHLRRRFTAMEVLNSLDPSFNICGIVNGADFHRVQILVLTNRTELQIEYLGAQNHNGNIILRSEPIQNFPLS